MRLRSRHGALWGFALALVVSLLLLPATAFAAVYPAANEVRVNGDVSFGGADLYYTNAAYEAGTLSENPSWNAHYEPSTGVLELRGYQGDSIVSYADEGQLTIKLSGSDSVVSAYEDYAIANYGGSVLVSSSSGTRLTAVVTDASGSAVGILASNGGAVIVFGSAKLDVSATSKTTSAISGYAHGLSCGGGAYVYDSASLSVQCRSAAKATGSSSAAAILALDAEFDTAGTVLLDTSACAGYNYAIQSTMQPRYTKAKQIGVMWTTDASQSGGQSYRDPVLDYEKCVFAVNVDEKNATASYRQGRPYKLNVVNGTCNMADGQYLEGDIAVITPSGFTGAEFVEWTADKPLTFAGGTDAKDKRIEIVIGTQNLTVTAKYSAFETQPYFTSTGSDEGVISYAPYAQDIHPGLMRLVVAGGDPADSDDIVTTYLTPGKTVYSNGVAPGQYQVALQVGGVWHLSDVFTVEYVLSIDAAGLSVPEPVAGEFPAPLEAVIPQADDYRIGEIRWFEGGTPGDPDSRMQSDDAFEAGKTYIFQALLMPKSGVVFDPDVAVSINGCDPDDAFVFHAAGGTLLVRVAFEIPAPEPEVYVGGVGLCDGEYLAVGSATPSATAPSGGYAHYADGVLTLSGYSYGGSGYDYDELYSAGIYSEGSLELVLEGENLLELIGSGCAADGIVLGAGDLEVSGDGSLALTADSFGIYVAEGSLSIAGGVQLDIASADDGIFAGADISLFADSLAVESGSKGISANGCIAVYGGELSVDSRAAALYALESITISDGAIEAVSAVTAVFAGVDIYVNDGRLRAVSAATENDSSYKAISFGGVLEVYEGLAIYASTEPDGELGEYVAGEHASYDLVVIGESLPPAPEYAAYVGGVGMNDGDYLANGAAEVTAAKPSGGFAHYEAGVLTLSGYSYAGKGYDYEDEYAAGIYSDCDLEVVLLGENSITAVDPSKQPEGIVVDAGGDLAISGTGSLLIDAEMFGIYLYGGDVEIDCGSLSIESVDDCISANSVAILSGDIDLVSSESTGIDVAEGIAISGGDVDVSARSDAMYVDCGDVTVAGGTLTARSLVVEYDTIYSAVWPDEGAFTVDASLVVTASTEPDGVLGEYDPAALREYDLIVVAPPPAPVFYVYVGGVGMNDGDYLANGATATTTAKPSGGYAYYEAGVLTLSGYEYAGAGYDYDGYYAAAVYSAADLEIVLVGENSLKATGSGIDCEGVTVFDGDLDITGSGSLSVVSDTISVYLDDGDLSVNCGSLDVDSQLADDPCITVCGDIVVSGGDIDAVSVRDGIYADGTIAISGGDVTVAAVGNGLCAYGDVSVTGGTLTAKSLDAAYDDHYAAVFSSAGSFIVGSSLVVTASTEPDGTPGEYDSAKLGDYDLVVVKTAAPEPPYSDLWKSFPDVKAEVESKGGPDKLWYVRDGWLDYAVGNGLMGGYTSGANAGCFGPHDKITRASVATMLYRAACAEDPELEAIYGSTTDKSAYGQTASFTDMQAGKWYTAAINWAKVAGIMTGDGTTGYTTVRPNDTVTRQELAVMLARYANGGTVPPTSLDPSVAEGLGGIDQVAGWAKDGMFWALNEGVISGAKNSDGTRSLNPKMNAERCEAAKMFTVVLRDVM